MMKPSDSAETIRAVPHQKRCAIYARYSSDQQRESSIKDQIRKCKEYAAKQGWIVLDECIYFDEAISGAIDKRPGLERLLGAADQKPKPFDLVLADDTSRLARDQGDQRSMLKLLGFLGVYVVSVSQGLDSSNEAADFSFALHGLMDERFLKDLANKVRRGQEGCVLGDKYIAGGRCYGYVNVPDEDPDRVGDYGRPFVRGVTRIIHPEQKPIVERIFQIYAEGSSFDKIARALRADGIPAPRPPRRNSVPGWSPDGISEILRNPIYIGQYIWKRTTSIRNPKTRRMVTRPVPENEWVRSYREDWRIISDDLWNKVQARRALRRHIGICKLGGLERTKRSEKYLFSGLLYCGLCGGAIRIVDTDSETVRYGCGTWRDKGACTNTTRIRRESLEEQLIAWLTRDLPTSDRVEQIALALHARVQQQISALEAEARKNAVNAPALRKELAEKKQEAWNLTDFIVASGRQCSGTIQCRLEAADGRIKQIEELLSRASEPEPVATISFADIMHFLLSKLHDVQAVLTSEPIIVKQVLRQHISKVILTPSLVDGKRVLHVKVEFNFNGGGNSGVMLTETMDAFSQQYAFSTITVTGLALDTSRVRRKRTSLPNESGDCKEEVPAAPVNVSEIHLPTPESSP